MEYEEGNRELLPIACAVAFVLLLVSAVFWWWTKSESRSEAGSTPANLQESVSLAEEATPQTNSEGENLPLVPDEEIDLTNASEVAGALGKLLLNNGKTDATAPLLPESLLSAESLARLQQQAAEEGWKIENVREVGELEREEKKRFAIKIEGRSEPLMVELDKQADGTWQAAELPKTTAEEAPKTADSLAVSDNFVQAVLSQKFQQAQTRTTKNVTDTRVAALCILFEEGRYRLNPEKPLRPLFVRDTTAAYIVDLLVGEDEEAQFGLTLKRADASSAWQVQEVNLDSLLGDYAQRVAGGDIYYTPLVPNPAGGDTLVIYFGFDEQTLADRTRRQLDIVAEALRDDDERTLTISGHADAKGSNQYNRQLSRQRAVAVNDHLVMRGVDPSQILIEAEGESQPRRPNETASGEDDPDGRRANRRTEIYLDF